MSRNQNPKKNRASNSPTHPTAAPTWEDVIATAIMATAKAAKAKAKAEPGKVVAATAKVSDRISVTYYDVDSEEDHS